MAATAVNATLLAEAHLVVGLTPRSHDEPLTKSHEPDESELTAAPSVSHQPQSIDDANALHSVHVDAASHA